MIRKLLPLCAVLFLSCADAHAAQIIVHFASHTGFGLYGDRLEQRGPDGFWDLDVPIDITGAGAARVSWNGIEYSAAILNDPDKSHIVFRDTYGLNIITLYKGGVCGASAHRVSGATGKPNIVVVPCTYR